MLRAHVMPPRNLGNRNPGIQRLGDDPPLLLRRPAPAASYPGANLHPPTRELRVVYSVGHICKTLPLNQREACDIPRAGIKVGTENRLRSIRPSNKLPNPDYVKQIIFSLFSNSPNVPINTVLLYKINILSKFPLDISYCLHFFIHYNASDNFSCPIALGH